MRACVEFVPAVRQELCGAGPEQRRRRRRRRRRRKVYSELTQ